MYVFVDVRFFFSLQVRNPEAQYKAITFYIKSHPMQLVRLLQVRRIVFKYHIPSILDYRLLMNCRC